MDKRLDDEVAKDNWDETDSEPEQVQPTATKRITEATHVVTEHKDPFEASRARQRIVEEADQELLRDLFEGCTVQATAGKSTTAPTTKKTAVVHAKNPLDQVLMRTQNEIDKCATKLGEKIATSTAASSSWLRFLDVLLTECAPKMSMADINTLSVKMKAFYKEKREKLMSKHTKNTKAAVAVKVADYKEELDMVYGQDEDEGSDEEYYDQFM